MRRAQRDQGTCLQEKGSCDVQQLVQGPRVDSQRCDEEDGHVRGRQEEVVVGHLVHESVHQAVQQGGQVPTGGRERRNVHLVHAAAEVVRNQGLAWRLQLQLPSFLVRRRRL